MSEIFASYLDEDLARDTLSLCSSRDFKGSSRSGVNFAKLFYESFTLDLTIDGGFCFRIGDSDACDFVDIWLIGLEAILPVNALTF